MNSSTKLAVYLVTVLVIVGSLVLFPASIGAAPSVPTAPGRTTTALSDGRWLLLGGVDEHGIVSATAALWDPQADAFHALPSRPGHDRAWHTATGIRDRG